MSQEAIYPPYSLLAPFYRVLMRDIPYRSWFHFICQQIPCPGTWVDLFAGAAEFARIANGVVRIVNVDRSAAMLEQACGEKIVADAKAVPLVEQSAVVASATNCSINYLADIEAVCAFFSECHRLLKPQGILVFDYCPIERAQSLQGQKSSALGGRLRLMMEYHCQSNILYTTVQCISTSGQAKSELHRQRIFSDQEIFACLNDKDFAITQILPNYGLPSDGVLPPIKTVVAQSRR
ncbi:MAG: class I SAM-dependent methyltransferase [Turneriella sp.]|nr:class I SAM-dependent methyltransferase [Turneriella sp.]